MTENRTRHLMATEAGSAHTTAATDFQRSVAVVIGINDYGNGIPRLSTAVNDARRLAKLLGHEHKYTVHLLAEDVTKTRLTDFFQAQLPSEIDDATRLLLYFAGHGVVLDSDDGPAGYLVPQDADTADTASFLPMNDLHAWLEALPCRHLLLILDCCFAGAIRWTSTRNLTVHPQQIYRERYQLFVRSAAWQAVTSAAYDEKALDILQTGDIIGRRAVGIDAQHSPFALALFEALAGAGDTYPPGRNGHPPGDGLLTAHELFQYLRDKVALKAQQAANHRQIPGLWPLKRHHAGEYVFQVPGRSLNLEPAPPLSTKNNPYRGLKSYDEQHAPLFFGRTQLIKQLAQQVEAQPLTLVVGASGTGKSSLVKAGVLPYVRHMLDGQSESNNADEVTRKLQHGNRWHILPVVRPTEAPLQIFIEVIELLQEGLTKYPGADQRDLLVIDQFEEVITLCRNKEERTHFLDLLADLLAIHHDRLRLVLTLRSDFEPQFATAKLITQATDARFIVPPMNQAELREVIEGPASERVLFFDPPKLVDKLIDEVIQTPGALPLLSFTLEQLYFKHLKRQEAAQRMGDTIERALTQEDYDALGGVIGSLRTRADEEYAALPDKAHRTTMQRMMLRMVAIEGGELARRRVPLAELVYPIEAENKRVQEVIDRLVEARLLVSDSADVDGDNVADAHVEPAHDALVRAWDQLLRWKQSFEEYLPLQRTLTAAANGWAQDGRDAKSGLLWNNNPRLLQLHEILSPDENRNGNNFLHTVKQSLWPSSKVTDEPTWLNRLETEFVQTSVVRRANVLKQVVGITLAVIVMLIGITAFALVQREIAQENEATAVAEAQRADTEAERAEAEAEAARQAQAEAEREAAIARSRQLAAQSASVLTDQNTELALGLAIEAGRATEGIGHDTREAFEAIRTVIARAGRSRRVFYDEERTVDWVQWSVDGSKILTINSNATVRILAANSGEELVLFQGHNTTVLQATWSADESKLLTRGADDTVRVWDANSGEELVLLQGHEGEVSGATWSRDDSKVLTIGCDEVEIDDSTCIKGTVRIWAANSGEELALFQGHSGAVLQATWSADESKLLTRGADGTVRIWNANSGEELVRIQGHVYRTSSAEWNADESKVLTIGCDEVGTDDSTCIKGTVRIWDANIGKELVLFQGHSRAVLQATWNADESKLLTRGADYTVRIWDANSGKEVALLEGHRYNIILAEWSADESKVITVGGYHVQLNSDDTIRVWDANSGEQLLLLSGTSIDSAKLSADKRRILTIHSDRTTRIWDLNKGEEAAVLRGHTQGITQATWSTDASRILTTSYDGTARIWNASDGEALAILQGHSGEVLQTMWSGDESKVLTRGSDGTIRIWDATNGVEAILFQGHEGSVNQATWNKNESKVLTGSEDHTARIWDANSGEELVLLQGHEGEVSGATWSRDDSKVLTSSSDGTVRIWDANTRAELVTLQSGRWSYTQWSDTQATWSADESKILTLMEDGTARIWDATSGLELVTFHNYGSNIYSAKWNRDESKLLTLAGDNIVRIWDATSGTKLAHIQGYTNRIHSAEWNAAGTKVLTVGCDELDTSQSCISGTVHIWNVGDAKKLIALDGYEGVVGSAMWNADGSKILTLHERYDYEVRIWDADSGEQLSLLQGHEGEIYSAMWNADESKILTSSADDTARIWDADTGEELVIFLGHEGIVDFAEWSTDESKILTSSLDHTVRLWDASTGEELMSFRDHTEWIQSVEWSADESKVLTSSADNTARIWHTQMPNLLAAICAKAPRNFTWEEWQQYMDQVYRPTCAIAPIPPDVIAHTKDEAAKLIRVGALITATTMLDELNGWLQESRQIKSFGVAVRPFIATILLDKGRSLMEEGRLEEAIAELKMAANFENTLNLDALTAEATERVVAVLIDKGRAVAQDGRLAEAIAKFEEAAVLSNTLDLDTLMTESTELVARTLVEEGYAFAGKGELTEAITKFEEAAALNDMLDLGALTAEAKARVVAVLVEEGRTLVQEGQLGEAVAKFEKALALHSTLDLIKEIENPLLLLRLCQQQANPSHWGATCDSLMEGMPQLIPSTSVIGVITSEISDLWWLDITTTSRVTITLSADNSNLDTYLTLYDIQFRLMGENDDLELGVIQNSLLSNVLLSGPSRYWIQAGRCCPNDDGGSTGRYVLDVTVTKAEE